MSTNSAIEWTESTWNPITGCTKISLGCVNCYAEKMSRRLKAMGQKNYINGFDIALHSDTLDVPFNWKKSQMVFVNSMSDMFHEDIPLDFIKRVFDVMNKLPQHTFQVLTKRADRLNELAKDLEWSDNIWMGVTVEHSNYIERINHLRNVHSAIRFLSLEPLLSSLPDMNLENIDWVIVGGESGIGSRPIKEEWVIDIHEQCKNAKVPFFFKQWGGVNKKKMVVCY